MGTEAVRRNVPNVLDVPLHVPNACPGAGTTVGIIFTGVPIARCRYVNFTRAAATVDKW